MNFRSRCLLVCTLLVTATVGRADPLPGTAPLVGERDFASDMVDGIDRFLLRQTGAAPEARGKLWHRDTSSPARYVESIASNRERFRKMIGAVDAREPAVFEWVATGDQPALVGKGDGYDAYTIRWPVLKNVWGEGLLLNPRGKPTAMVVALPDADQTPEMIAGLVPGVPSESQFARRLAESGCCVVIPTLVDRSATYSVLPDGKKTGQPDREFLYRPAFEVGRHVIGFEVQKVLAAVDAFAHASDGKARVGVIGYGEGGLLALYAGAADDRIAAVCVSGYFDSRQEEWREPIYRNLFGLLREFGDAEIASLIAPRALVVETCKSPEVAGPPPMPPGKLGPTPGALSQIAQHSASAEFERAREMVSFLTPPAKFDLVVSGNGEGESSPFGSTSALEQFLSDLDSSVVLRDLAAAPEHVRKDFDPRPRQRRQVEQIRDFTQEIVRTCDVDRAAFWNKADRASRSPEKWEQSTQWYRDYFANEVIGRFDIKRLDPSVRTRPIYDEPKFTGYEVLMDVFPDVIGYGILLVPKDIPPGEHRPVVVCQHGLEGRPQDAADPKKDSGFYHAFACRLAEQGFVTYSPQNPYIFGDRFRSLQRKANPLGKTLFSIIVPQHEQATDWLASLPFVDPQRIAFYGLSYGGKTAMRVPALVPRYCLSICSGDFNEWVAKNALLRYPGNYVGMGEYEIFEWDLGHTFNYAEMAGLIAPRPFMVERGHHDGVAPDEWVAFEYAKVRRLYADLNIPDRTSIEFFDGPHTIHGVGTFKFLHDQLKWPEPKP